MKEDTVSKILEIRRVINEQYVTLMYIDAESEQDEKDTVCHLSRMVSTLTVSVLAES